MCKPIYEFAKVVTKTKKQDDFIEIPINRLNAYQRVLAMARIVARDHPDFRLVSALEHYDEVKANELTVNLKK